MTTATRIQPLGTPIFRGLGRRVSELVRSINVAVTLSQEFQARRTQIEVLNGLSTAQLAQLGLTRDAINAHVYPELLDR